MWPQLACQDVHYNDICNLLGSGEAEGRDVKMEGWWWRWIEYGSGAWQESSGYGFSWNDQVHMDHRTICLHGFKSQGTRAQLKPTQVRAVIQCWGCGAIFRLRIKKLISIIYVHSTTSLPGLVMRDLPLCCQLQLIFFGGQFVSLSNQLINR